MKGFIAIILFFVLALAGVKTGHLRAQFENLGELVKNTIFVA